MNHSRQGFGLIWLLIGLIVAYLLFFMKPGFHKKVKPREKPNAPIVSNDGGYIEQNIAIGQQVKHQVRGIQKTLEKRYQQYR